MILAPYQRRQPTATFTSRFLAGKENRRNLKYFADRKDMKKFHDALKTIYGPKSSGVTTLLAVYRSTLLTDNEERWAE